MIRIKKFKIKIFKNFELAKFNFVLKIRIRGNQVSSNFIVFWYVYKGKYYFHQFENLNVAHQKADPT